MKTHALLISAALMAASSLASAQTAGSTPAPDAATSGITSSAEPAAPGARNTRRAAPRNASSTPAVPQNQTADLTTIAPKDSSKAVVDEVRSNDRIDRRGVNCSLYPARCP